LPNVGFGYIVHILISYHRANENAAMDRSPTNRWFLEKWL